MTSVRVGAAGAAAAAVLVTLPAAGRPFALAVLLWGGLLLVELALAGHRPLVPAAAVGVLGAPIGVLATGHVTWERVPTIMALMLLAAFLLALVSPRKRQITATLSATVLLALVVGLGTGGVLVLRSATAGFRWTLGLILVTAVPVTLGALAARLTDDSVETPVRVVSAGAAGGALLLGMNPPFDALATLVLAAAGLAAAWATGGLLSGLRRQGDPARPGALPSATATLTALASPLVAAPVVAFLAFATQA